MMGATGFLTGSGAIDLVLVVMAGELAWLAWLGRDPRAALGALLPGVCLVLALRGALAGADWVWIALPLGLSLPLHLADLRARGWLARPTPSVRSGAIADRKAARR